MLIISRFAPAKRRKDTTFSRAVHYIILCGARFYDYLTIRCRVQSTIYLRTIAPLNVKYI